MNAPIRYSYTQRSAIGEPTGYVPLLPLTLEKDNHVLSVEALLDTGAAVSVMPYSVGKALGYVFEAESISLTLSGNLSVVPTRVIIVSATVGNFAPVRLAFAGAQTDNAPLLLSQVNFFATFNVCFYRSQLAFDVTK